jgi:hypothetical protein
MVYMLTKSHVQPLDSSIQKDLYADGEINFALLVYLHYF